MNPEPTIELSRPDYLLNYANNLHHSKTKGHQRSLEVFNEFRTKKNVDLAIQDLEGVALGIKGEIQASVGVKLPEEKSPDELRAEIEVLERSVQKLGNTLSELVEDLGDSDDSVIALKRTIELKQKKIVDLNLLLNPPAVPSQEVPEIPSDPQEKLKIVEAAIEDLKKTIVYFKDLKETVAIYEKEELNLGKSVALPLPVDATRRDVLQARRVAVKKLKHVLQGLIIIDYKKDGFNVKDQLRIFFEEKDEVVEKRENLGIEPSMQDLDMALWFANQKNTGANKSRMYSKLNGPELEELRAELHKQREKLQRNETNWSGGGVYGNSVDLSYYLSLCSLNEMPSEVDKKRELQKKNILASGVRNNISVRNSLSIENYFGHHNTVNDLVTVENIRRKFLENAFSNLLEGSSWHFQTYFYAYLVVSEQMEKYYCNEFTKEELIKTLPETIKVCSWGDSTRLMKEMKNINPVMKKEAEKTLAMFLPFINKNMRNNRDWLARFNDGIGIFFPDLIRQSPEDKKQYLARNVEGCGDKELINGISRVGLEI